MPYKEAIGVFLSNGKDRRGVRLAIPRPVKKEQIASLWRMGRKGLTNPAIDGLTVTFTITHKPGPDWDDVVSRAVQIVADGLGIPLDNLKLEDYDGDNKDFSRLIKAPAEHSS